MVSYFSETVKNLLIMTGIIVTLGRALNQSQKGFLFIIDNTFKEKTKTPDEIFLQRTQAEIDLYILFKCRGKSKVLICDK